MEDSRDRLEQIASAVEDLIFMGAVTLPDKSEARLSDELSTIISNLKSNEHATEPLSNERTLNLIYHSLLIFMNEQLRLPKSFAIALGADLESHRDDMKTGQLMSTYVQILAEILSAEKNQGTPDIHRN